MRFSSSSVSSRSEVGRLRTRKKTRDIAHPQNPGGVGSASERRTGGDVLVWGLRRIVWPLLKWGAIAVLPFVVMMRGALYVYHQAWPLLIALGVGFMAAFSVLFLYATWAYVRLARHHTAYGVRTVQTTALLVLGALTFFQGYVLLAPDPVHVKSDDVYAEYSRLHPLLRMSVAPTVLVDEHLLITDLSRHPRDYEAMGLPINPRSLHYPRAGGYVRAVDLRTKGHYEVRNLLLRGYFAALGFRTLRHVGTADHLHVALPLPRQ